MVSATDYIYLLHRVFSWTRLSSQFTYYLQKQFKLGTYGSFNKQGLSAKILMNNERRLDRYLLIYTMRSGSG